MNILFIHGNYPAQFRHLCQALAADRSHNVVFLTAREDAKSECYQGLQIEFFNNHRLANDNTHHYLHSTEQTILSGQAVARQVYRLIESGFCPELIVCHAGNGLSLFLKEMLPLVPLVGYFEWYFCSNTSKYLFEDFTLDNQFKVGVRNFPILRELEICDAAVVPTNWQKKQFPNVFHDKLQVIFDGIDNQFFYSLDKPQSDEFKNNDLILSNRETGSDFLFTPDKKIVSYATRGMEPLRCFPEFMRSLPSLLSNDDSINVIIAGSDRRAYSYDAPTESGSWKDYILEGLGDFSGKNRIFFTGLLDYENYRNLLWRTDLHCYFTRPYVTSWSLFEACACGSTILTNTSPATASIAQENSFYSIDIDMPSDAISSTMSEILHDSQIRKSKLKAGYSLSESKDKWQTLLNRVASKK